MGLVGVKPSIKGPVGTGAMRARVGQMPGRLKGTPEKALEGRLTGLGGAVAGAGALGAGGAGYAGYKALSGGKGEEKQTAKAPEKKEAPKEKKEPKEKEAAARLSLGDVLRGGAAGAAGGVVGAGLGRAGAQYAHKVRSDKGKEKKKEAPKEKKEPEEKEAQLGTPFTDGLLQFCLERKLDGEQVADLLEKGAQAGGWIGEECQGLLDRMVK
jgi:hypothetical protein